MNSKDEGEQKNIIHEKALNSKKLRSKNKFMPQSHKEISAIRQYFKQLRNQPESENRRRQSEQESDNVKLMNERTAMIDAQLRERSCAWITQQQVEPEGNTNYDLTENNKRAEGKMNNFLNSRYFDLTTLDLRG
jgi:phosphoenolpyruvate-protein kinase (PTS system EI component)